MEIEWQAVREFPDYSVSNYGDVVNEITGRVLSQSTTAQGAYKVNFIRGRERHCRSVKVLVAEAFVEGQDEIFDTPVHLDGNQYNNRSENLVWRPRWFAWKYSRQFFKLPTFVTVGPILEIESQVQYMTVYDAGIINGLLFQDIWDCISLIKENTFPTGQRFWM